MDMTTRRVVVDGLRKADVPTLEVLTQDVVNLPLNQIDPITLCDLFALSEVGEGIPTALAQELSNFCEQRGREMLDLPDGSAVIEFAAEIQALPAVSVPNSLREALATVVAERKDEASAEALNGLLAHLGGTEPEAVTVSEVSDSKPSAAAKAGKAREPAKKKAPAKRKTAVSKDPERVEWIRLHVLERLSQYEGGLKESIIVGGTRHKAPWSDVTEREVRSVLRALARENIVRTTVGRWLIIR